MAKSLVQVALINAETERVEAISWVIASNYEDAITKAQREWTAPDDGQKRFAHVLRQADVRFPGQVEIAHPSELSQTLVKRNGEPFQIG